MHWLKLLRSQSDRNALVARRRTVVPQIESLERRQMMSIDPVAEVAAPLVDDPGVTPLALTDANIQETWQFESSNTLSVTENTGEKPQSKVWTHDGEWFAVLPNSSGTWIWRLDDGNWTQVLRLSDSDKFHADAKAIGNITHILLFDGGDSQLSSVQYVAATKSYQFWSDRPGNVSLPLADSAETATIDVDSLGRMWVAYDNKSSRTVEVRYSDGNYANWSGPITVASGLASDDISGVIALGNGQIGVFWSNQNAKRFGFRTHTDGANPNQWNASEVPAEQSAQSGGMADDHLNLAATSDGTLYAAVKTSYDGGGRPEIALLVRRPNGSWDNLYGVAGLGTRPVVIVNEQLGRLIVAYTERDGGGNILYRETSLSSISFGPEQVLIGGSYNNVTSTKQSFTNELLVMASSGSKAAATLLWNPNATPQTETNQAPIVSAGPDRSTPLGSPAVLSGSVSDDGYPSGTLNVQWLQISGPGSATFNNANSAATTVSFNAAGTYVLRLVASDGSLSTSDDVTVVVTASVPTNEAPNVSAGGDLTGQTGVPVVLSGSASDDGQPSNNLVTQWSVVSGPGTVTFGNAQSPSTSATFGAAGTYVLRLTASDGSLTSSDDVTVVISAAASGNVVGYWDFTPTSGAALSSTSTGQGTLVGGATITSDGKLNLNGSGQRYEVPSSPALQIADAITISVWIKPTTRTTQYVVKKADSSGIDGFELSLSNSGTLFVRFNADSSGNSYRVDSTSKYPTNGSTWMHVAATYDGSTIRLYINGVEQGSKAARFTIATNNLPLNIGSGEGGYRSMKGQLDDVLIANRALSASEISQVYNGSFNPAPNPTPVNQAPSVNAGADRSGQVGSSISLLGSVSDDNLPSGSLTSTWSVVSGPGSVNFANSQAASTTAAFATAGTYVLRLTASDGALSAQDDVVVTVTAPVNQAPNVNAGADATTTVGSAINLSGTATDDGQPYNTLTSQWTVVSGPGSVTFGNASSTSTTASFTVVGTYYLRLTASDGALSTSDDVAVSVVSPAATNQAPAGTDTTVTVREDATYTFKIADFGFSDPGNSPANALLSVKITTLPTTGSLTLNGASVAAGQFVTAADIAGGTLRFTPTIQVDGPADASFTFQVRDNGGTANGGIDLDPTPNTLTVDVTLSANLNFVRGLYKEILGRTADLGGLIAWTNQLNGGASTRSIATGLWNSREHRGLQVDQAYQTFLKRAADSGGRQFWISQMQGGMTEEQLAAAFLNTVEYRNANPPAASFVDGVYRDLLGRASTTAERSDWVTKLNNGSATTAQMAQQMVDSHDHHLKVVDGYYLQYLRRAADSAAESYWTGELDGGRQTEASVAVSLLSTTEFYNLLH